MISTTRKAIACMIVVVLSMLTMVLPVSAYEYWEKYDTHYAHYTITNNNLTPEKEMAEDGVVNIRGRFKKADNANYSDIYMVVQIRDYNTQEVLAEVHPYNTNYPDYNTFTLSADVYEGQEIQFYFDVCSINNPPGPYRMAEVEYDAWLSDF